MTLRSGQTQGLVSQLASLTANDVALSNQIAVVSGQVVSIQGQIASGNYLEQNFPGGTLCTTQVEFAAAYAAATAGSTIILFPQNTANYTITGSTLKKGVSIIGVGPRQKITIDASGAALSITSEALGILRTSFENITFNPPVTVSQSLNGDMVEFSSCDFVSNLIEGLGNTRVINCFIYGNLTTIDNGTLTVGQSSLVGTANAFAMTSNIFLNDVTMIGTSSGILMDVGTSGLFVANNIRAVNINTGGSARAFRFSSTGTYILDAYYVTGGTPGPTQLEVTSPATLKLGVNNCAVGLRVVSGTISTLTVG